MMVTSGLMSSAVCQERFIQRLFLKGLNLKGVLGLSCGLAAFWIEVILYTKVENLVAL